MLYGFCTKFHTLSSSTILWKSVKISQCYRQFKGGNFFRHSAQWSASATAGTVVLVPCHTCDFVERFCRATLTRDKIARQNRRCDMALTRQINCLRPLTCNWYMSVDSHIGFFSTCSGREDPFGISGTSFVTGQMPFLSPNECCRTVVFITTATAIYSLMPMTHAPETGARNRRQKTGVGFWRVCHTIWCRIFWRQILESDRTCSISRQNLATTWSKYWFVIGQWSMLLLFSFVAVVNFVCILDIEII